MNETDWRALCEAIMKEPDPEKLGVLVDQLITALDQRELELRRVRAHSPTNHEVS
jgi:hypothetical protein